jgi:Nucleotidyltransferase domain
VIAAYLDELTQRLRARLGDRLVAVWVVGSGALGDFDPERSDVDVQAVSAERLTRVELEELAAALSHESLPCPVRGLEFVLYAREDLADPLGPAFQLNLNTGPRMSHHAGYDPHAEPRFWFVLDAAIARDHARPLAGAHPRDVISELPRDLILTSLQAALAWWRAHDDAQAAVAACRALAWVEYGRWLSKREAVEAFLDRVDARLSPPSGA